MEVSEKSETPEPKDIEMRKIVNMMCHVKSVNKTDGDELEVSVMNVYFFFFVNHKNILRHLTFNKCFSFVLFQLCIVLRMDDKMNRQLTTPISADDNSNTLAEELVKYGFINEVNTHHIMKKRKSFTRLFFFLRKSLASKIF